MRGDDSGKRAKDTLKANPPAHARGLVADDIPRRGVAAAPRLRRGSSVEIRRGGGYASKGRCDGAARASPWHPAAFRKGASNNRTSAREVCARARAACAGCQKRLPSARVTKKAAYPHALARGPRRGAVRRAGRGRAADAPRRVAAPALSAEAGRDRAPRERHGRGGRGRGPGGHQTSRRLRESSVARACS